MFADNLVPHVLRLDGVLWFDPELVARIERGELIEHGSPEEVEIRACAVHAVELLVAATWTGAHATRGARSTRSSGTAARRPSTRRCRAIARAAPPTDSWPALLGRLGALLGDRLRAGLADQQLGAQRPAGEQVERPETDRSSPASRRARSRSSRRPSGFELGRDHRQRAAVLEVARRGERLARARAGAVRPACRSGRRRQSRGPRAGGPGRRPARRRCPAPRRTPTNVTAAPGLTGASPHSGAPPGARRRVRRRRSRPPARRGSTRARAAGATCRPRLRPLIVTREPRPNGVRNSTALSVASLEPSSKRSVGNSAGRSSKRPRSASSSAGRPLTVSIRTSDGKRSERCGARRGPRRRGHR